MRHLFKFTGEGPKLSLKPIYASMRIDSVVNRASVRYFQSNKYPRGRKICFDFVFARNGCVFCDSLVENGTLFSRDFRVRLARKETAKRNERLGSFSMLVLVREKVGGGRWCLASTAAFYLSVSSRHLTDRIQLMIRRETTYVQERFLTTRNVNYIFFF